MLLSFKFIFECFNVSDPSELSLIFVDLGKVHGTAWNSCFVNIMSFDVI